MNHTHHDILAFFRERLQVTVSDPHEDLISSGKLDSLGLVELLFFLEERFQVRVDVGQLDLAQLRSVSSIADLVGRGGA